MSQPVARQNDPVTGTDIHILVPPSGPPVPTPLPYAGTLVTALSPDVFVNNMPVATQDSVSQNMPPHIPPPPSSFSKPPTNLGKVIPRPSMVLVNNKPIARMGDLVATCNDPVDAPTSSITTGSPDVMSA